MVAARFQYLDLGKRDPCVNNLGGLLLQKSGAW